ncbi:hypothetical protein LTR85_008960 [Meristemomyces frigidus]|nr:hypothetical protein LTR85_008960 [Meristemomyces frigidus]
MATNSLMTLPAELRVRIYEYALAGAGPIRRTALEPGPSGNFESRTPDIQTIEKHHKSELKGAQNTPFLGASLLFVNRLAYQEALPIFYQSNTLSISRGDFCHGIVADSLRHLPDIENLVHLKLFDFEVEPSCGRDMSDCDECRDPALDVLSALRLVPSLRTVVVDYGADEESVEAFTLFKSALRAPHPTGRHYSLACIGIARYEFFDHKLPHLRISMTNSTLAREWTAATPEWVREVASIAGRSVPSRWASREDGIVANVCMLMRGHDGLAPLRHIIPTSIAAVWPRNVPVDFRTLGEVGTLGFVEKVDDGLQKWLDMSAGIVPFQFTDRW